MFWAKEVEKRGSGEILLTSIDKEGTWSGFDIELTLSITNEVSIPVIAPIALKYPMERMDNIIGHNILNVNGDSSSGALAAAVKASQLIFLTDVEGVMDESGRLIELMTEENVNDLLESGVASGGMIPKLEAAIHALPYVEKDNIVDGRKPKAIINCYQGKSIGTTITRR